MLDRCERVVDRDSDRSSALKKSRILMKETSKKSLQIEKTEKCFSDLGFVTKPIFPKILAVVCHFSAGQGQGGGTAGQLVRGTRPQPAPLSLMGSRGGACHPA